MSTPSEFKSNESTLDKSDPFYLLIVIAKHPGSKTWEGMGERKFNSMPRLGELIELTIELDNEPDPVAHLYKIVAVINPTVLPEELETHNHGDIHVVCLGTTVDVKNRLLHEE